MTLIDMRSGALVSIETSVHIAYGYDIRGEVIGESGTVSLADRSEVVVEQTAPSWAACRRTGASASRPLRRRVPRLHRRRRRGPGCWPERVGRLCRDRHDARRSDGAQDRQARDDQTSPPAETLRLFAGRLRARSRLGSGDGVEVSSPLLRPRRISRRKSKFRAAASPHFDFKLRRIGVRWRRAIDNDDRIFVLCCGRGWRAADNPGCRIDGKALRQAESRPSKRRRPSRGCYGGRRVGSAQIDLVAS